MNDAKSNDSYWVVIVMIIIAIIVYFMFRSKIDPVAKYVFKQLNKILDEAKEELVHPNKAQLEGKASHHPHHPHKR